MARVTIAGAVPCYAAPTGGSQSVNFGRVLETVAGFFERTGARNAVIGVFGSHAYGLSRGTFDLAFVAESAAQPQLVLFVRIARVRDAGAAMSSSDSDNGAPFALLEEPWDS